MNGASRTARALVHGRILPGLLVSLLLLVPATSRGQITVPPGFTNQLVAAGLTNPTTMAFAPDGRIFVSEQAGNLRVIKNGALLTTPFLQVTCDSNGERGLLGVAFDPTFLTSTTKYVYIYYTATTPTTHNRVSRFQANGDVAVPGSEQVLLDLDDLSTATNHNGGALHFGPEGKLYISAGDNANGANSQSLSTVLGKILRINPDGTIPADNPFFNTTTGKNRAIWALGLRNPFTFAFQPGTGRMLINDVGQSTWEEIDEGIAGANYGWPDTEGVTTDPRFTSPILVYGHTAGDFAGCAIIGGAFYNPRENQYPSQYIGRYFFGDLCNGWIGTMDPAHGNALEVFAHGLNLLVDMRVGPDGSLYYLSRGDGAVYKAIYNAAVQRATAVVLDRNRQPLSGAEVHLFDINGQQMAGEQATTADDGAVTLDNVAPGAYHIGAYKAGYNQWMFSPSFQGWNIVSGSVIGPIEIVLDKVGTTGAVQGFTRFDDATGAHPIGAGVHIDVYSGGHLVASTDTDANGKYVISGLPSISIDGSHPWWGWYTYIATWNGHKAIGVNFGVWAPLTIRMDIPFKL